MTIAAAAAHFAAAFESSDWLVEVGCVENCRCRGGPPENYITALSNCPLPPGLLEELATWRGWPVRFFVGEKLPRCKE